MTQTPAKKNKHTKAVEAAGSLSLTDDNSSVYPAGFFFPLCLKRNRQNSF